MLLEDHLRWMVYNYPGLYRVRNNPEQSRLHALEHLFFTIGGGYDWDIDGYLAVLDGFKDDDSKTILKEYPQGYFAKELYEVELSDEKQVQAVVDDLGDRFSYVKETRFWSTRVIFEATEREAQEIAVKWDEKKKEEYLRKTEKEYYKNNDPLVDIFVYCLETKFKMHPYPLSKYSAICELMEGRTDSPHIENFEFKDFPVREDWFKGCVDVVTAALEHYKEEAKTLDSYNEYSHGTIQQYKRNIREQIDILKDFFKVKDEIPVKEI
jgi:hypothetical protein